MDANEQLTELSADDRAVLGGPPDGVLAGLAEHASDHAGILDFIGVTSFHVNLLCFPVGRFPPVFLNTLTVFYLKNFGSPVNDCSDWVIWPVLFFILQRFVFTDVFNDVISAG